MAAPPSRGGLRVALIAHPRHAIRPPFEGGMEAHTWNLARGLAVRGHDVTLFAAGGSEAGVPLVPLLPEPYEARFPWAHRRGSKALTSHLDAGHAAALARIGEGGFDVVHNAGLHRFPPRWARAARHPAVSAMHVPPFDVLHRAIDDSAAPWHVVTTTSAQQQGRWWDAPPAQARVVSNGIDLAAWPFRAKGGGGAAWAGRIMPNKGTALAVRAARLAGLPLTLYGAVEDRTYFDAEVAPLLGGGARYEGHLPGPELAKALGRADALLFTPMWDEPFGLAAIEAMAVGLPVASFENGAVREVVGPCGAYAPPGDVPALAAALRSAAGMDRHAARTRVERRFGLDRMIDAYEACYTLACAHCDDPWPEPAYAAHQLAVA
jgi:glycosyltransferase involved in cell wall biosynthesis